LKSEFLVDVLLQCVTVGRHRLMCADVFIRWGRLCYAFQNCQYLLKTVVQKVVCCFFLLINC